jgi:protein KRI1
MANLYQDGDDDENAEKPTWDDDIDIGDILPSENVEDQKSKKKRKNKKKDEDAEEDGVDIDAMDADVVQPDDEEWDGTEEMRKRKLDEYMDELYGMEFNDLVRFLPSAEDLVGS